MQLQCKLNPGNVFLYLVHNVNSIQKDKIFFLVCFLLYRTEERQFWIGFNKRNPLSAGSWKWSDGTPVSFSKL